MKRRSFLGAVFGAMAAPVEMLAACEREWIHKLLGDNLIRLAAERSMLLAAIEIVKLDKSACHETT